MPEVTAYAPGTPCWVDLMTPSPAEDAPFYTSLLGWDYAPAPGDPTDTGGYGTFSIGGKAVAGIGPLMGDAPPCWSTYISVEDVAATAEQVKQAGGSIVVEPMQVLDVGHMAVCADPSGAVFSLWQPLSMLGAELINETGALCWNELNTRDSEGNKPFYGSVFGWTPAPAPSENYTMFKLGDRDVAGMIEMDPLHIPAEVPPNWTVYFAVDDADATATKATELGGSIIVPPFDVPVGRITILTDPVGAPFCVVALSQQPS
ncbi:MAG: VOC family protein [Actinobacteria bacterium]|nr:VOC family protein [Actinomycetota bacterium]